MSSPGALLLSQKEVTRLLDIATCIPAIEMAFRYYAEGKTSPPKVLAVHLPDGAFHIKAGAMQLEQNYFVAKTNANLPGNPRNYGLPTIQGIILVFNADNGKILAVMDSIEITILRTGAATGVAAKYLSRKDSRVATICGCGNQGEISLKALVNVRNIQTVYAFDSDHSRALELSKKLSKELGVSIIPVDELRPAVLKSDICVTCTPSKNPILFKGDVRPGCFIAAVGTDNEEKNEIDADLLASCKLVTDISDQSASIGDLHHALKTGLVKRSHIHAELGEIVAGKKEGRTSDDETILFDSTGMALQDVVSAAIVYERAIKEKYGVSFNF